MATFWLSIYMLTTLNEMDTMYVCIWHQTFKKTLKKTPNVILCTKTKKKTLLNSFSL